MKLTNQLSKQQFNDVYLFLSKRSYWSKGINQDKLRTALDNSLCFALVEGGQLIAFARVVSDFATFANLLDVFVLEPFRGKGFGKKLIDAVVTHPKLQGLRRFTLATHDAHDLYRQFGFECPTQPEFMMERYDKEANKRGTNTV
ncbi:GNAT family N-acetyltransferase [Pseudoalteromonas luteoviolacea]|uniref:GNAT family N-acetyltransferase n=1 Tax=Pseudoalteromonas luteoviolacea TaxID=43657 RepID=UPI001154D333|nr:GNAT family N-acetyltransferase [Pseudoalteromonas luteoviolacea]TQF66762.1 GNAT family N-acetyltransferase [Pseudoalteromonas luteoviolacea]